MATSAKPEIAGNHRVVAARWDHRMSLWRHLSSCHGSDGDALSGKRAGAV